jgi:hypothetical protein
MQSYRAMHSNGALITDESEYSSERDSNEKFYISVSLEVFKTRLNISKFYGDTQNFISIVS